MPEPIEIVIRKTQETSTQVSASATQKDTKGKEDVQRKAMNTALIQAGKQLASYGFSQYGNLTGNTIRQRQMDDMVQLGSYIGQIVAGGKLGVLAVGVQLTTSAINNSVATRKANQQAELLYQRSGNITLNGGRGTYD